PRKPRGPLDPQPPPGGRGAAALRADRGTPRSPAPRPPVAAAARRGPGLRHVVLLLAACAACAHADITPPLPVEIFGQNLSVEVESGENRRDLPEIAAIAAEAL